MAVVCGLPWLLRISIRTYLALVGANENTSARAAFAVPQFAGLAEKLPSRTGVSKFRVESASSRNVFTLESNEPPRFQSANDCTVNVPPSQKSRVPLGIDDIHPDVHTWSLCVGLAPR